LHVVHAVHAAAFWVVLKVPAAQAEQVRLEVEVPAAVTYCPGLQVVQAVHAATLVVVLKVPAAQAAHARSLVTVPGVETN
jgi:hypothetical protein